MRGLRSLLTDSIAFMFRPCMDIREQIVKGLVVLTAVDKSLTEVAVFALIEVVGCAQRS